MLNHLMGQLPNASEHGFLIDNMLEFCHWFMLVLFVGWSTFFCFMLWRFHKSRNPKADYHGLRSHASTHIEFMVILVEAVILLGFALPIWGRRVNEFPKTDALHIHVIGEQFKWNFHFPGPDGKFCKQDVNLVSASNPLGLDFKDESGKDDIVALNEMHLPVDKDVIMDISSKDVIHSFMMPSMRVGQDAIPGQRIPLWFRPIRTGDYEIVCAQLCGNGHYSMRGLCKVDTQANYEAWYKEMQSLNSGK